MDWPVILTGQSQDDLQEIVVFIARNDQAAARRLGIWAPPNPLQGGIAKLSIVH